MSRQNPTELPAHMAVLGLVIEKPNQTVSEIARTLNDRFVRSRFSESTAYGSLDQMTRGRSVRVQRTHKALGSERAMDRYRATERGLDVFNAWMFALPGAVPAIREAMYGRLELARLEHLPRLIRTAREEELIAIDLYAAANERVRGREVRRKSRTGRKTRADHERAIRETLLYVDPLHWSSRAALYVLIAERLEEIADEAGVEFEVPAKAGIDIGGFGG
jgi:DNA-binding PadR family transcriptional regulator